MSDRRCWCGGEVDLQDLGRAECVESIFHAPHSDGTRRVETLYVAGPMSGYPECNYPAFRKAAADLREAGWRVVNPAERADSKLARHYVDLLRDDLVLMLQECQGVAVLPGWENSNGARMEVELAKHLGMAVRTVDKWADLAALRRNT